MNKVSKSNLKQLAESLENELIKYGATDEAAMALLDSLSTLIKSAKDGSLIDNVENVPGRTSFTEKGLSKYRDLEEAYALFKLEVTLGDFSDIN